MHVHSRRGGEEREGWGQRCPPDLSPAPQLWAARRREWTRNGCSDNLPSPMQQPLDLVFVAGEGPHSSHSPPPCARDLWRCGFCLAFPESQFGGLCWRRLWKGSRVGRLPSRHEPLGPKGSSQREHLPQDMISLHSQPPASSSRSLQPRATHPLFPLLLHLAQLGVTVVQMLSAHLLCGWRTIQAFPRSVWCVCVCVVVAADSNCKLKRHCPFFLFPWCADTDTVNTHRLCD